jgi:hypothetical protein
MEKTPGTSRRPSLRGQAKRASTAIARQSAPSSGGAGGRLAVVIGIELAIRTYDLASDLGLARPGGQPPTATDPPERRPGAASDHDPAS